MYVVLLTQLLSSLNWIRQKVRIFYKKCDAQLIIVSKTAKDTLMKSSKARKDSRDEKISNTSLVHVHSE